VLGDSPDVRRLATELTHHKLTFVNGAALLSCELATQSRREGHLLEARKFDRLHTFIISEREARQLISVGETYDFEFEPTTKGDLRLEVLITQSVLLRADQVIE